MKCISPVINTEFLFSTFFPCISATMFGNSGDQCKGREKICRKGFHMDDRQALRMCQSPSETRNRGANTRKETIEKKDLICFKETVNHGVNNHTTLLGRRSEEDGEV